MRRQPLAPVMLRLRHAQALLAGKHPPGLQNLARGRDRDHERSPELLVRLDRRPDPLRAGRAEDPPVVGRGMKIDEGLVRVDDDGDALLLEQAPDLGHAIGGLRVPIIRNLLRDRFCRGSSFKIFSKGAGGGGKGTATMGASGEADSSCRCRK